MPYRNISISRSARQLLRYLAAHKNQLSPLLILAHNYPDPDALASGIALKYLAEKGFDISAKVVYGGVIGRMENRAMVQVLKLPVQKLRGSDFKKYSKVALVDTQPAFENNPFPKHRKPTLIIDQHTPAVKPLADCPIINPNCGATSVILVQALMLMGLSLPSQVATALAYGILSDTLHFSRSSSKDVIQCYLDILPFCNMQALAQIQNPSRSRRFFSTLGRGIQNAAFRKGLIVSHLGAVENPDLVSQVADFLLTYQKAKWALCTGRYKTKLHVSLRAGYAGADAAQILRDCVKNERDAGGHGSIAGGSFRVSQSADEPAWEASEQAIVAKLMKRLRIAAKSEFYFPFRRS